MRHLLTLLILAAPVPAADPPAWDEFRNRLAPDPPRTTRQDFGPRPGGAVGGRVQRSLTPASFAKPIPPKTLADKLTASGRLAVTRDEGGTGTLLGWFHDTSRGWRTPNSLALRVDGNGGKFWAFDGRMYQTTKTKPFPADGTWHTWTLTHDPAGDGLVVLTLDGAKYPLPLAPGHKAAGATFNRFGVWNQQLSGDGTELLFDELVLDGAPLDPGRDGDWVGVGNRVTFADRDYRPWHDFGPVSGQPDALAGTIWRDERPAYCAAPVGPLTLDGELSASGQLTMTGAGADSGVYLGFFDAAAKRGKATPEHQEPHRHTLGLLVEGPSRVGHYVRPMYRTSTGDGGLPKDGPVVLSDGKTHDWAIRYVPTGAGGRLTVTWDGRGQTLEVPADHRRQGAAFDRFGLFNVQSGGHHVRLTLTDLRFTTKPAGR